MKYWPFLRVFGVLLGRPDRYRLALMEAYLPAVIVAYLLAMVTRDWWVTEAPVFTVFGIVPQMGYLGFLAVFSRSVTGHPRLTLPAEALFALMLEWDVWCSLLGMLVDTGSLAALPAWAMIAMAWAPLLLLWLGWLGLLRVAFGGAVWPVLSHGVWAALLLWAQLWLFSGWDGFWTSNASDTAAANEWAPYRAINVEDVYYRQAPLISRALDAVAEGRPGVPEYFFVGFAGWARQDVFWKEMQFVDRLMASRYGTANRHVLLVNHLNTLTQWPIANRENLARVLAGVAKKMNPEDVLFLFLSSHGAEDDGVSTRFWPLSPNDIQPDALKAMLDAAGIAQRVLVISACYSGQFVEPLKDDNTVIATAASADRTSFGCSNENDFTYYGEALFADGLAKGEPLLQALESARMRIDERETAEEKTHSEPQLWLGKDLTVRLGELEPSVAQP